MRLLVTGAYGFLGTRLCRDLTANGHDIVRQGRGADAEARCEELTDANAVGAMLDRYRPEVVVNLAALAEVDVCESDPGRAFAANVGVPRAMAQAVAERNLHLVHISTDQVYNGRGPHPEDDGAPINVYGITKYAGELEALRAGGTVLRTNFVGRPAGGGKEGFSDWIVASLRNRAPMILFQDVLFSPLHISSLLKCIVRATELRHAGVFNAGSRNGISKADFALGLATRLRLDTGSVRLGTSAGVGLKARRPNDMRMSVERFETAFSFVLPSMQEELDKTARDYGARVV